MSVLQNIIYQKVSKKFKYLNGKVAFSICQTWRMQQRKHRMGQTAYHAGQWTKEEKTRQLGLSASNADVMDEERRYRLADGATAKNIERTE